MNFGMSTEQQVGEKFTPSVGNRRLRPFFVVGFPTKKDEEPKKVKGFFWLLETEGLRKASTSDATPGDVVGCVVLLGEMFLLQGLTDLFAFLSVGFPTKNDEETNKFKLFLLGKLTK